MNRTGVLDERFRSIGSCAGRLCRNRHAHAAAGRANALPTHAGAPDVEVGVLPRTRVGRLAHLAGPGLRTAPTHECRADAAAYAVLAAPSVKQDRFLLSCEVSKSIVISQWRCNVQHWYCIKDSKFKLKCLSLNHPTLMVLIIVIDIAN